MTATTRQRRGVTLMEVMIATAILSVGMVAIMALFPIGAVNFARALNQDRSATHAVNSDAMFGYYWKKAWVERDSNSQSPTFRSPTGNLCTTTEAAFFNSEEPMLLLLEYHPNSNYGPPANPLPYGWIRPGSTQASFPVLVDPVGWQTRAGDPLNQGFVAGNPNFPVRTTLRRAVSTPSAAPDNWPFNQFPRPTPKIPQALGGSLPQLAPGPWNYPFYPTGGAPDNYNPAGYPAPYQSLDFRANIRLATLLDDLTLNGSGESSAATGQLERAGRYSTAWLIQRARNDVPTDVDGKGLVFAGRSVTDTPSAETAYDALTTPGTKTILIKLNGQAAPALRRGAWVGFTMPVAADPSSALTSRTPSLTFTGS